MTIKQSDAMGLNTKGKRQIVINDRRFYWCISRNLSDIGSDVLTIISEDKAVLCYYPLFDLHGKSRFMIACGEPLGAEAIDKRGRRAYLCPRWENEDWSITPKGVAKFIEWCLSGESRLVEADQLTEPESGRGGRITPATPPTPPGMRGRTGRFQ